MDSRQNVILGKNEIVQKMIDGICKMTDEQFEWFIIQALPVLFDKDD